MLDASRFTLALHTTDMAGFANPRPHMFSKNRSYPTHIPIPDPIPSKTPLLLHLHTACCCATSVQQLFHLCHCCTLNCYYCDYYCLPLLLLERGRGVCGCAVVGSGKSHTMQPTSAILYHATHAAMSAQNCRSKSGLIVTMPRHETGKPNLATAETHVREQRKTPSQNTLGAQQMVSWV